MATEKPGIYAIRHRATGRVYVGSASNISKRWSRHRIDLRQDKHLNKHLQSAWNKYGEDAFDFTILELTSDLDVREQFWMDSLRAYENGFNLCSVARSSRGRPPSEKQRQWARDNVWRMNTPEMLEKRRERMRALNRLPKPPVKHPGVGGPKGEYHGHAKLDWSKVRVIRLKYGDRKKYGKGVKHGGVTMQSLATEYEVGLATIHNIVRGVTWIECQGGDAAFK